MKIMLESSYYQNKEKVLMCPQVSQNTDKHLEQNKSTMPKYADIP